MRRLNLLFLLLMAGPAFADCMTDSSGVSVCGRGPCARDLSGEIYCAQHRYGAAVRDNRGKVVCGMGQCQKDLRGNIYCSIEPGGDVTRNTKGEIECFGGCELAAAEFCERVIAEH